MSHNQLECCFSTRTCPTNTLACSIVRCTYLHSSRHRPGHDTCLLQRKGKGAEHCGGKSRSFDTTTRGVATRSSWICRSRCAARWRQSAAASAAHNGYQRVGKTTTRAYGECVCACWTVISGSIVPWLTYFHANYPAAHQIMLHIFSLLFSSHMFSIAINFHYSRTHVCTSSAKHCSSDKPNFARWISELSSCRSACRSERPRTFYNKRRI